MGSWEMFNEISSTYDKINRVLSLGMDLQWRKRLARYLPLKPNLSLLDLATGTGDQLFTLFESRISLASACGVDLAEEMLEIAKKKASSKSYKKKIEWRKEDAEDLSFASESFHAVTCSFGIRNMKNPQRALEEMHRVLKPQGKCLILEFSLPPFPIRPVYLFYLRRILPRIGGWLSQSPAAYRYLDATIEAFPLKKAFCQLLEKLRFRNVTTHSMAFGAVALYTGTK